MGRTIRILLVLLTALISFVCVPTLCANDDTDIPDSVTGKIEKAYRDLSMIVIRFGEGAGDIITIAGFPFHNLEAQLDEVWSAEDSDGITIAAGDCVTVEYSVKDLCSGDTVYKWESLTAYCEGCNTCEDCSFCEDCIIKAGEDGKCYVSGDLTRVPQQNNNRSKP